jgi:hypothetical protein
MIPLLVALAQPANAFGCPCEGQQARLDAFADKVAHASTLSEAQDMALDKVALSRKAIHLADKQLDGDPAIAEATAMIDAFDAQVRSASSQEQVSVAFNQLSRNGHANRVAGRCDYTGGEIVIIVIGFLLGIIPGIIFLFLLC